jgi:hypothetical protein
MNKATNKGRQQDFKGREGNCGIPTVDFFHISTPQTPELSFFPIENKQLIINIIHP